MSTQTPPNTPDEQAAALKTFTREDGSLVLYDDDNPREWLQSDVAVEPSDIL